MAQIAADAIGVPLGVIDVTGGDTEATPFTPPTPSGSRSASSM
ncbi:hypothetical protein [Streptomyces sp. NBC_01174]